MSASSTPTRVLQPYRRLAPTTNPYIVMLHQALEATPGVEPVLFSYPRALLGGYDVVHLHWPETRLEGRSPARRYVRRLLAFAFLLRVRIAGIPIVRTLHNLDVPQGLTRTDYLYLRLADRWTSLYIRLNETTPVPEGRPYVTVPHGHYRDWYAQHPRSRTAPGRIAYAGLVRRYKNVVGLVTAFVQAHEADPGLSLVVAGKPSNEDLVREIRAAAGDTPDIHLDLRFLDDVELVRVVTEAELVALPFLQMHNSGTILLALSLDRPVLVPRNEANQLLADEVGPGWVQQFDGELTGDALLAAVSVVRRPRAASPDLSRRDWTVTGAAHRDAYLQALSIRRGRR